MKERLDADDPCPVRDGFSWPAELAPHARTWMCWPCRVEAWGGPDPLLRAKQAYARVARAISTFEPVTMAVRPHDAAEAKLSCAGKVGLFEVPLDDSWARDMGPTFLRGPAGSRAAVQWRFNAWGNKYHPYAQDAQLATRIGRASAASPGRTAIVTGSKVEIARATRAKACLAQSSPSGPPHASRRHGQHIQVRACGAHSAGQAKPSRTGQGSSASMASL